MIYFLFVLLVCGVLVYLVNALIPMDARFKLVFNCVIGLCLVYWLLSIFGMVPAFPEGRFGRP